jgi:hypothetical protein
MSRVVRHRRRIGAALTYPASLMLSAIGLAQTPDNQGAETRTHEQIPIELFQAPHPKSLARPDCDNQVRAGDRSGACKALREGDEGWVELGFMVDPRGKPFEITDEDAYFGLATYNYATK